MHPSRGSLARRYGSQCQCLSFLLMLRLVTLTLVALITVSVLILAQQQPPQPPLRSLQVTLIPVEKPAPRHYEHWYDDFPPDTAPVDTQEAEAPSFDARLPHETLQPRPISP